MPKPGNCVRFCLQLFANKVPAVGAYLLRENEAKNNKLSKADRELCPVMFSGGCGAGGGKEESSCKASSPGRGVTLSSASSSETIGAGYDLTVKEGQYKNKIAQGFLDQGLDAVYLPEWGTAKKGKVKMFMGCRGGELKQISSHQDESCRVCGGGATFDDNFVALQQVRDIYFRGDNVVMVTNDRVSAFDFILPNLIPFKGFVLNAISECCSRGSRLIITGPPPPNPMGNRLDMKNIAPCVSCGQCGSS